jgi:hypothetical protein
MPSPDRLETRILAQGIRPSDYELGLNRMEAVNPGRDWQADDMAYVRGFIEGVKKDFEISIKYYEVPLTRDSYDAFLSGLAGFDYPGLSSEVARPIYDRPRLDRSYDLGLKLLFLYLGYHVDEIESRRIHARVNPNLLEHYREEAEKLRNELAA